MHFFFDFAKLVYLHDNKGHFLPLSLPQPINDFYKCFTITDY